MASDDDYEPGEWYALQATLSTPAHVSCLAFGHAGHLFAGSDDGTLRIYDLSSYKVIKAVRGQGEEISSLVCVKRPGSEFRDVWLASGRRLMKFQMDSPKMIQTTDDALVVIDITDDHDDVLNEIALNSNKSHIAFSMDSGTVGVVDLATKAITRMRSKHDSVCGSVKFIPNRPRELLSGGYDTALLHFDFHEGKILSARKIPPFEAVGGMGLSPPFIMCTAISSTGIIAAGTADGRLYIGCGGCKTSEGKTGKKKRSRKWEGLDESKEVIPKQAEGPIVALAFDDSGILTVSTLLGVMSRYEIEPDDDDVVVDKLWEHETQSVKKVNSLIVDGERIVVGGLTAEGKGVIEIWKRDVCHEMYELYGVPIPPPAKR